MTTKPVSARPLTFRDLQEIVARLANDPRVHPSTPIEIVIEHDDGESVEKLAEGLGAVCVGGGAISLREHGDWRGAFAQ